MSPLPPLVLRGDCLVELARIPDASVDAIVTDPPYGLEFMGKGWDSFKGADMPMRRDNPLMDAVNTGASKQGGRQRAGLDYQRRQAADMRAFEVWVEQWSRECLRILKPGGHMLAFGGSRTWHRLAAGIEDAGFEIRDSIAWLYGSGFPKSLDVSKAIDKAAGATREVVGTVALNAPGGSIGGSNALNGGERYYPEEPRQITAPATDAAREWEGWGTALKPAFEPIVVARKPLTGTVAANVLAHGTGALNIDATRIGSDERSYSPKGIRPGAHNIVGDDWKPEREQVTVAGRWPANVVLDETQAAALDTQSGASKSPPVGSVTKTRPRKSSSMAGGFDHDPEGMSNGYGDSGGASRFFYVAKAPKSERPVVDGLAHPTVKPLALMRWLCRLVTPEGGVIVDPFAGSGTTLEAAYLEGFESIGVEMTPEYWPLIEARIARVTS